MIQQLDPDDFAKTLSQWLEDHQGELPRALALDGKWIRDRVLSVSLSEHESGAPVAIGFAGTHVKDDGQKREGEQTVARKLYSQSNLNAAVITADCLHNSQPDAQAILDAGADYVLQIKQENRHSYKAAEQIAEAGNPLLATPKSPTALTDASTAAP